MDKRASILLALDVGEKRIGVASADAAIKIAVPVTTLTVDGTEVQVIADMATQIHSDVIVVGYPRNQSGEPTAQTAYVEAFAAKLKDIAPIEFQDESLTSVMAEDQLRSLGKPYAKADIDARAAAIILQDYMEIHYAA